MDLHPLSDPFGPDGQDDSDGGDDAEGPNRPDVGDHPEEPGRPLGGDHPESPRTAEVDLDIAVLEEIERDLADVERALDRLGEGSYGRCETCGATLSEDELESAPAGRFCPAHLPLDRP